MTRSLFKPQEKSILSQLIYETLKEAILKGDLLPGERLIESSIAKQMNVSRAPLREAIRQLEKDGLLEVQAHRETRVASFSLEDIQELHLIRVVLETLAAQFASKRLTQEQVDYLEQLYAEIKQAAEERDASRFAELDYEFHEYFCKASGWPRLFQIWKDQHVLLRLWFNVVAESHDDLMQATAQDHRTMLDALEAKDDAAIANEVFKHIYYSGPAYTKERSEWACQTAASVNIKFQELVKDSQLAGRSNNKNKED